MYIRFTAFWTFSKLLFVLHIWLLRNFYSGDAHHGNYSERCSNHHFRYCANCLNQIYSIWDSVCFQTFRNCTWFCTFWLLRNLYYGDAHHANYAKNCLHHHFQHFANWLYKIYSVLKLFQIAVCFAHFGFYEISTPVMRTIPIIGNFV